MPARLHHERIARTGIEPARWLLMTHGIYGAGSNWRSIARKLHERRPEWGVVLVDLRQHGRSEPGEPPHTIAACAEDLRALIDELSATTPITALAGHSFGGKVALATRRIAPLAQTWILDASPSARPEAMADPRNSVLRVLALMERLPRTWAKRDDFVAAVMADGHELGLAQWLAMNVVPDAGGTLALRLDLGALRAMLADYYATDLWPSLAEPRGEVHFVVATRSPTLSPEDRTRLAEVAARQAEVRIHLLDMGHWLHIEAPGAVVELLAGSLPAA